MTNAARMAMMRMARKNRGDMRMDGHDGNMRMDMRGEMNRHMNESNYRTENNYDAESAFRDRRGRRHYDNGRFAPKGEWEAHIVGDDMRSEHTGGDMENRMDADSGYYDPPRMRTIGFDTQSRVDTDYRSNIDTPMRNEGSSMPGGKMSKGGASSSGTPELTKEKAEKWMKHLKNGDGSKGPHWTMEQTKQVMVQQAFKCDPLEFWVAMNIMYSDYYNVARKLNMNNITFYSEMAAAFLEDEDAVEDKLGAYYESVVEHR